MSELILRFLVLDVVALLAVASFIAARPFANCGFVASGLCGVGMLLCLPPLVMSAQPATFGVPAGPPGLSLHLALDSLSAFFLFLVFLAGTAIATCQALSQPLSQVGSVTPFCLAGTVIALLAGDGVSLAIGVAVAGMAMGAARWQMLLMPLLLLTAVCLLAPSGYAPRFDAIRAASADPDHVTAAAALSIAAVRGLVWPRAHGRCGTHGALAAGVLIPFGSYLLLRLLVDLALPAAQPWWGFGLVLVGSLVAIRQGWRSAGAFDLDGIVDALMQRQVGLALTAIGLALIARAADLPGSALFALQAVFLLAVGGTVAGTLMSLAADAIGRGAGTYRLSGLGGLIHLMPRTSAGLAAGVLALTALPPALGFACLWLLFQSVLSAPRSGDLPSYLPLAITAAALALSAALATAASVRLIGIAVLGRPRTARGSAASEGKSPVRWVLLTLGGVSLLLGVLPGPATGLLAEPAIHVLLGAPPDGRAGLAVLSGSRSLSSYLPIPVLASLALASAVAGLVPRWSRKEVKAAGLWADGMPPPAGLPFGEPAAQSAGAGFLPALPRISPPRLPRLAAFRPLRPPPTVAAIWLLLAAFGTLLLILAISG